MKNFIRLILSFLFTLNIILTVNGIRCFDCRSVDDPKCADPFDNSTIPLSDCDKDKGSGRELTPSMCQKIRQKVNGEWHYIRNCAYLDEVGVKSGDKFCVTRTGTDNIFSESCTCNSKHGCNSSVVFRPLVLLVTMSTLSLVEIGFVVRSVFRLML